MKHIFLFVLNVFILSVCTAAPRVPTQLTQNGLVYCTHTSGFSLNPQTADAGTSMNVITEQIYDKLFESRNNSSQVTPVLATSYFFSQDSRTLVINLRSGVKFHQTPWFTPTRDFNADDVVFSLNRVLGHDTALAQAIENSATYTNPQHRVFQEQAKKVHFPYFESIKLNEKIQSVRALSPYQVEIKLFRSDASILSHLAGQYAIIFSQEYAQQLSRQNKLVQLDQYPVGTGPYQLKDYFRNQYVRLVRHAHYWQGIPKISNIVIDMTAEKAGRLIKFFNNECQITAYPEVSLLGLLSNEDRRYQIKSTESMNMAFLAFNAHRSVTQDVELRRAVAQAINRKRILRNIYHNTATLANTVIPKISWASGEYVTQFAYDYNPEQAQSFFRDKNIQLTMWVVNEEQVYNPAPIKMAELIKSDLAAAGVKVKVRSVTRNFLIEQLKNKTEDYDMILTGWLASSLDPDSFMRPILSCDAQSEITNLANWCDPKFDQIMDFALTSGSPILRAYDYHTAQKLILSELPIIPLAHVNRVLLARSDLQGLELTPFGTVNFSKLSFKEREK